MSCAPSIRALARICRTVSSIEPFIPARTCTASLPEARKTPRQRSATVYRWPGRSPTMLLPAPTARRSAGRTVRSPSCGNLGSRVRANSILRVLAGGSLRWAFRAASTRPVRASETIHDRADRSRGRVCAARPRGTWRPGADRGRASRTAERGPCRPSCRSSAWAVGTVQQARRARRAVAATPARWVIPGGLSISAP
ncbi:hypothetical protein BEN35_22000 [Streptomyces fradiae]|nr:hypothetical protein BEN35_22000 [Streptomyces fradiae]